MARIKKRTTGVVVTTLDEVAQRLLGNNWEQADAKSEPKKAAAKSDSK